MFTKRGVPKPCTSTIIVCPSHIKVASHKQTCSGLTMVLLGKDHQLLIHPVLGACSPASPHCIRSTRVWLAAYQCPIQLCPNLTQRVPQHKMQLQCWWHPLRHGPSSCSKLCTATVQYSSHCGVRTAAIGTMLNCHAGWLTAAKCGGIPYRPGWQGLRNRTRHGWTAELPRMHLAAVAVYTMSCNTATGLAPTSSGTLQCLPCLARNP